MSHSSNNQQWQARREAAVVQGVGTLLPVFIDRAHNAELWDVEGNRYIDFASGIAVLNTGHRHPQVMAAVQAQLDRYTHTCFQVLAYEPYIELAERLIAKAPGDFAKKAYFLSTGAEAVENAVKIARAATKRQGVIAFGGGFHGRTLLGMALGVWAALKHNSWLDYTLMGVAMSSATSEMSSEPVKSGTTP